MARHEGAQLAREIVVAAALEVGVDAVLEARDAQLLEMVALGLRERLRELGERRSAPEGERLAQARPASAGSRASSATRPSRRSRSNRTLSIASGSTCTR
jgi:hypothetical protein